MPRPSVSSVRRTDGGEISLASLQRRCADIAGLQEGLKAVPGVELLGAADANILFCRPPRRITEGLLAEGYAFYHDRWAPGVVRFVTSFATTEQDIDDLVRAVARHAA
ncbi:hypothetical protein ABZ302_39210 [Streptomyces sp. NPDC006237]|uniref:hypothetical protein n=1 Tax=Streptomyces sp. NPDC006237 TaxID=3154474 RepID=UPI0033AFA542